jgi:hypothetical protein
LPDLISYQPGNMVYYNDSKMEPEPPRYLLLTPQMVSKGWMRYNSRNIIEHSNPQKFDVIGKDEDGYFIVINPQWTVWEKEFRKIGKKTLKKT